MLYKFALCSFKLGMTPYDRVLRERIIKALQQGGNITEVSVRFEVHRHTVRRLRDRFEQTGSLEPLAMGGKRVSRIEPYRDEVCEWIEADNDITLAELEQRLLSNFGVRLAQSTLAYHLKRMGWSRKKKRYAPASGSILTSLPGETGGAGWSHVPQLY